MTGRHADLGRPVENMTRHAPAPALVARGIRLAPVLRQCDGPGFRQLTKAALTWLETNHQSVNALNVFPVPDGDTGTNMLLTMHAAYREVADRDERSVSAVAHAVAHGALMGARGNSGVILSQIWRGFARGLGSAESFEVESFVRALRAASDTAYRGVVKPVEGTILTVIKDVAEAAERTLAQSADPYNLRLMLDELVIAAQASVARTPDLLPLLKQAGVVDSGGKGFALLLEGMQRYLRGQRLDQALEPAIAPLDLAAVGVAMQAVEPGQEWEVVLDFRPRPDVHLPSLYSRLAELGTSIQVGEGDGLYRVHVHLLKSKRHAPLDLAEEFGTVVNVHMENLLDQVDGIQERGPAADTALPLRQVRPGQIGVVAVSPGRGISRLMASMGAASIVSGGQGHNPSTQDILDAINSVATDRVIVLPNNKNITLAAQQAADLSTKQVRVVPTRDVPQGMAALLNLVPDGELDSVQGAMQRSLSAIETGDVSRASRTVEIDGVAAVEGQFIGLHNHKMVAAGTSLATVIEALLQHMHAGERELLTLYYGAEVDPPAAQQLAAGLRLSYPKLAVEVHSGGQPHYFYILSVE